jgi:GNAT superfamily N-acetyltransferase
MDEDKTIEVTRTYLEAVEHDAASPAFADASAKVERVLECPASFFRYLYSEVGRRYHWVDRLGWSDEEIRAYLGDANVSLWVMYSAGAPAGYFELLRYEDGSTEIAYFGLLQEFIGRGLGKRLLSEAMARAWAGGANRVWLHTCTLDDPAAMPNYLKRGFRPFKQETYFTTITAEEERQAGWRKAE